MVENNENYVVKIVGEVKVSDEELARMKEKDSKPLSPNDFVEGGKFSLALFKKRIKEFPFIKKQPRLKKIFFTQKYIVINWEEITVKCWTDYARYRKNKTKYMDDAFGDYEEKTGAKLWAAYWTCPKYIFHPLAIENQKRICSKWCRTNLYDDSSYTPLTIAPISLAENVKRKKLDTCYASGGEFLLLGFVYSIICYCMGETDKKPDLTGYVIRK